MERTDFAGIRTDFAPIASRKLDQLDAAIRLGNLARPGNPLEALKGRRRGQWSNPRPRPVADLLRVARGQPRPDRGGNRRLALRGRHAMARDPIHPGETLREDLDALGMSAADLARRISCR